MKASIENLNVSVHAKQYVLAVYYAREGYFREAIQILEALPRESIDPSPIVHLLRGHLYLEMGLTLSAIEAYTTAQDQALNLDKDLETLAAAQAGLWWATGKTKYLQDALINYDSLGDTKATESLSSVP